MLDPDIYGLFEHTDKRTAELGPDLQTIAAELGYAVRMDDESLVNHRTKCIHLDKSLPTAGLTSDLAHELGHTLAREGEPSWDQKIRHRHASVPDIHAHRECLTDHQGDRLSMPREVVKAIIERCGLNAMSVWVLHQQQEVYLHEALRRIVHFNENARMGGFIARRGRIIHAESFQWWMPVWTGHPMPNPQGEFQGDGVSLFAVPGLPHTFIGLIVIEP